MSSATMDIPIDQLRALPLERRLEIVAALWESIEEELGPCLISSQGAAEANRDIEAPLADPASSIPWDRVRASLRSQIGESDPQAGEDTSLSNAEQAEIDRRLSEHKKNPGAATPVDTFLDALDRRYA